jgi:hypothetical protein
LVISDDAEGNRWWVVTRATTQGRSYEVFERFQFENPNPQQNCLDVYFKNHIMLSINPLLPACEGQPNDESKEVFEAGKNGAYRFHSMKLFTPNIMGGPHG